MLRQSPVQDLQKTQGNNEIPSRRYKYKCPRVEMSFVYIRSRKNSMLFELTERTEKDYKIKLGT